VYKLFDSKRREYGVTKHGDNYIFTCAFIVKTDLVLSINDLSGRELLKESIKSYKVSGNVYSVCIASLEVDEFEYYYICDGVVTCDPYRKRHNHRRVFGSVADDEKLAVSLYSNDDYDFLNDSQLRINQDDVIAYQLHVRGFTKHSSSKVKGKGCFLGIIEKIPYLKELNINQIELMPAYDFYEFNADNKYIKINHPAYTTDTTLDESGNVTPNNPKLKLNYWGFKEANYFCPKYEYSYSKDAVKEFKDMVKALHNAGIEVIMQMFYPKDVKPLTIIDSLRFWYAEYHVDGFHIMGERLPVDIILGDEFLYDAKLYMNNINRNDDIIASMTNNRNIIDVNDGFMVSMRRFLKSDGDSLQGFVYSNRNNSSINKSINFLTRYEGFSLYDLVSYEHKHNEENEENNTDGTDNNYSWNCGFEGKTSKKNVKELRLKQVKNALCLLLLSQGTPMLFMGDESLNSQNGNNNPYCQDNDNSWINWKNNKSSEEVLEFTKALTSFRVNHKVLHQAKELKNMDYLQTGYPDISYHQDMAWKSTLNNYLLHIGIMLDGSYAMVAGKENDTLYIAYNMHWENHIFGLPRLKNTKQWELAFTTGIEEEKQEIIKDLSENQEEICVYKRSVMVLRAVPTAKNTVNVSNSRRKK